jgi:hypothetical protein
VTQTDALVDALQARDQAIDTAMSEQDAATLDALLAEEFIYTHSNSRSQPRDEFVAAILRREQPPRRLLSEIAVERHDDIVVTRGNLDIVYHDDRPNLYMRYVRIYRLMGDTWRAISHRTVYATDRRRT